MRGARVGEERLRKERIKGMRREGKGLKEKAKGMFREEKGCEGKGKDVKGRERM